MIVWNLKKHVYRVCWQLLFVDLEKQKFQNSFSVFLHLLSKSYQLQLTADIELLLHLLWTKKLKTLSNKRKKEKKKKNDNPTWTVHIDPNLFWRQKSVVSLSIATAEQPPVKMFSVQFQVLVEPLTHSHDEDTCAVVVVIRTVCRRKWGPSRNCENENRVGKHFGQSWAVQR